MAGAPDHARPAPPRDGRPRQPVVPEPAPINLVDDARFASRWRTIQLRSGPAGHLWRAGGLLTVAVGDETVVEGVPVDAEVVREPRPWYAWATGVVALAAVLLVVALASGSAAPWYWLGPAAGAFAPVLAPPCVRVTYRDGAGDDRTVLVLVRPSREFRHRGRSEDLAAAIRAAADSRTATGG